jgi:cation diffusion facilitator family transporter
MAQPATEKTPFGHGRMEHIAPLIMSVFLFISGIQIGESAIHRVLDPHPIHYWPSLPWIILIAILIKEWLGQFVRFLGKRVKSHIIEVNAFHHRIDIILNLTVLIGLIIGNYYHRPEFDGVIGIIVAIWLLHLGYDHARDAIIPLLGKAPSLELVQEIRDTAKSVRGVEDVHDIIVHDYSSKYFISLHVEVSEKLDAAIMHGIMERCETKLMKKYGGEVICHTDPRLDPTPEIQAIEDHLQEIIEQFPQISSYHNFRVVAESASKYIIVADIKTADKVSTSEFELVANELDMLARSKIPQIAYCSFSMIPKFAY